MRNVAAIALLVLSLISSGGMGLVPVSFAQGDAITLPPSESYFRVEGRLYRARLSITTYFPGILPEGQQLSLSTYATVSIEAIGGGLVPETIRVTSVSVPLRRNGLRAPLFPAVSIALVPGYFTWAGNFPIAINPGQRLTARIDVQTRRGPFQIYVPAVAVGLASPVI